METLRVCSECAPAFLREMNSGQMKERRGTKPQGRKEEQWKSVDKLDFYPSQQWCLKTRRFQGAERQESGALCVSAHTFRNICNGKLPFLTLFALKHACPWTGEPSCSFIWAVGIHGCGCCKQIAAVPQDLLVLAFYSKCLCLEGAASQTSMLFQTVLVAPKAPTCHLK